MKLAAAAVGSFEFDVGLAASHPLFCLNQLCELDIDLDELNLELKAGPNVIGETQTRERERFDRRKLSLRF